MLPGLGDDSGDADATMEDGNMTPKKNNELSVLINKMIDKNESVWKCEICGRTARDKFNIVRHAEIHIEGISYTCHICSKTFANRPNLSSHI